MAVSAFMVLLFFHCVGDYIFQTDFLAVNKGKSWFFMIIHCILYTGCTYFALWLLLPVIENPASTAYFIFITHYSIDTVKCSYYDHARTKGKPVNSNYPLYIDQILHILILVVVYMLCLKGVAM